MSKTVIIGATENTTRYAYLAAAKLKKHGIEFVPIGIKSGEIHGETILNLKEKPLVKNVDTITMYIGATNQKEWEEYILSLRPRRIIFNPGAENHELAIRANKLGIETTNACTLVMLGSRTY